MKQIFNRLSLPREITTPLRPILLTLFLFGITTVWSINSGHADCIAENDSTTIWLNQRPVAICQSIFRSADANCVGHAEPEDFDSGSYDPDGDPIMFSVNPPGPYPLGTTIVELTVTDRNGASAICTPSILVVDDTPPSVSCAGLLLPLDTNGEASITPSNLIISATDNCSSPNASLSQSSFTCADLGSVTVIVTATDASGNAGTCSSPVSVLDFNNVCPQPPDAQCQNLSLTANSNCEANANASDFDNGSSDPNGDPLSYTVTPIGPYSLGTTNVVLTVTDLDGDTGTCLATVTVEDITPPTVSCQGALVPLGLGGTASIAPNDLAVNITDDCMTSINLSQSNFNCADLGTVPIVVTATDVSGNSTTCNTFVSVFDNNTVCPYPPTAQCQNLTLNADANCQATAMAIDFDAGSTDPNGDPLTYTVNPVGPYFLGTTNVVFTVTDLDGETATCAATVTVNDNTPPVITCQDITLPLDAGGIAMITTGDVIASMTDNCILAAASVTPSSFNCNDLGQSVPVNVVVTDASGNSTTCSPLVTISDPNFNCPAPPIAQCQNLTLNADANCQATAMAIDFDAGSSDPNGDPLTYTVNPVGPYFLGTTNVVFTVTDLDGETATCAATVTVNDNTPPVITCQDITLPLDAGGIAMITTGDVIASMTDNCILAAASVTPSSFNCNDLGQSVPVNVVVTDASGNSTTCSPLVTISDPNFNCPAPPIAQCQNLTLNADANCQATAMAIDFDAGSTDPNGDPLSYTVNPTGPYSTGTTNVVFTVTDLDGETATCGATVTVNDMTPPSLTCQDLTVQLDPSGMASITIEDITIGATSSDIYTNSGQSLGSSSTADAHMVDLNGDGFEDAFVVNGSNQPNRVFLNDGTGNFTDTGQSLGSNVSTSAVVMDLDDDGDADAFVANSAGRNKVYFNDGAGNFTDSGQNLGFTTNNTISVAMGDLDGDNDPDAFVCNYNQYCQVFLNNGNGFFSNGQQISGSSFGYGVALAHLNNDAYLDAFVANSVNGGNKVYFNNGNGSFTGSGQSLGNSNSYDVALLDLNADTYIDAFVVNVNQPNKVWLNDGVGNFTDSGQNLSNAQSGNVEFADFDGDGILDAFVGNTNSPNKIWLNDGSANFIDSGVNIAGLTGDLRLTDVENDGDLDMFLMKSGPNQVWLNNDLSDNCGLAILSVMPNTFSCTDKGQAIPILVTATDAAGNTTTCTSNVTVLDTDNPCPLPPVAQCQNLTLNADANCEANATAMDFDNGSFDPEGDPLAYAVDPIGPYPEGTTNVIFTVIDLSGESATCAAIVTVTDITPPIITCQDINIQLDANGMATITENDVLVPNVATLQFTDSGQSLGGNAHGSRVILADFDGDGDDDAFVANLTNQPNTVWFNDGAGNFTNSGQSLGLGESHGLATSDLDMDGDLDVFVGNTSLEPNKIYLNDGLGNFTDSGQSLNSLNSDVILLGDLDGDLDDDAVVINYYGSKVWFNDGNANFTDSGQTLAPSYSYGADMQDLDGDGDLDIFVASRLVPDRVWLNNGSGTFTDSGQLLGTQNTEGCALGDLDGDGDYDVYMANTYNAGDEVWLNDGNANFSNTGQSLSTGLSRDVKLSDVDNDGDLDAFVGQQGGNRLWLNDGNANFTNSGLSMGSGNTWGLAMSDLDGDGDEDAFIANVGNPNRVWFNTTSIILNNGDNCGQPTYTLSPDNFSCAEVGQTIPVLVTATDAAGNSATCTSNVTVLDDNNPCADPPLALNVKVFLSSSYDQVSGLMGDVLRTTGYLPVNHPFNATPWSYSGTETITGTVLNISGNDAIVDWVLVELRDKNDNTNVLVQLAALLQRDGDVVDVDGTLLTIPNQVADDYYVAIHHRNHLGAMTLNAISLSATPTVVDFSTIATYGTNAQKLISGVNTLWSGDADASSSVNAGDRSIAWNTRNQTGYLPADFDLNGSVNAADRVIAWNHRNILAQMP